MVIWDSVDDRSNHTNRNTKEGKAADALGPVAKEGVSIPSLG